MKQAAATSLPRLLPLTTPTAELQLLTSALEQSSRISIDYLNHQTSRISMYQLEHHSTRISIYQLEHHSTRVSMGQPGQFIMMMLADIIPCLSTRKLTRTQSGKL